MGSWIQHYLPSVQFLQPSLPDPADIPWGEYFPFPTPYPHQVDGIEAAVETSLDGGITIIEGACGTGKTLIGLTAALGLIRHPDTPFERVHVITSVKQQLRAFEDSIRLINENCADSESLVTGLTLVGKADLCPMHHDGIIDESSLYETCAELRETTGESGSPVELSMSSPEPIATLPKIDGDDYCPYYARYLADLESSQQDAFLDPACTNEVVIDPETALEIGTQSGTCPHASLTAGIDQADVLIGNYNHAFDPQTQESLTDAIIGPETILVADEAHMLEPQIRSLRGQSVSLEAIEDTMRMTSHLCTLLSHGRPDGMARSKWYELLNTLDQHQVFAEELHAFSQFLQAVRNAVSAIATEHELATGERIALTRQSTDAITQFVEQAGWQSNPLGTNERAADGLAAVNELLDSTVDPGHMHNTVSLVSDWFGGSQSSYLKSLSWSSNTPLLELLNLVPRAEIARELDRFGAVILMSATLSPIDVYRQVTGVDTIDRPVTIREFPMTFPPDNRGSFAVSLPAFTYANRGDPDEQTAVRAAYAEALITIANSPGNILVCLPSYGEASWAADVLRSDCSKAVLLDESSGEAATEALKSTFFEGDAKVLITSLRGTLTEGVDYRGDRLHGVAICGVPVVDASDPQTQAIRAAYDDAFGDGYRTALAAPALRKTRQAIGRVIRGEDDVGIRVLLDERYTTDQGGGVRSLFPAHEREDFEILDPENLADRIAQFWQSQNTLP